MLDDIVLTMQARSAAAATGDDAEVRRLEEQEKVQWRKREVFEEIEGAMARQEAAAAAGDDDEVRRLEEQENALRVRLDELKAQDPTDPHTRGLAQMEAMAAVGALVLRQGRGPGRRRRRRGRSPRETDSAAAGQVERDHRRGDAPTRGTRSRRIPPPPGRGESPVGRFRRVPPSESVRSAHDLNVNPAAMPPHTARERPRSYDRTADRWFDASLAWDYGTNQAPAV